MYTRTLLHEYSVCYVTMCSELCISRCVHTPPNLKVFNTHLCIHFNVYMHLNIYWLSMPAFKSYRHLKLNRSLVSQWVLYSMSRFHFLLNLSHTYSVILLTLWKYCPQQQERNGEFAPVHGGVILLSNTTTTLQHLATTKATNTETGARPPHTQRAECQVSVTGGTYTTISRRPHISHACRASLVDPAVLPLAVCGTGTREARQTA